MLNLKIEFKEKLECISRNLIKSKQTTFINWSESEKKQV